MLRVSNVAWAFTRAFTSPCLAGRQESLGLGYPSLMLQKIRFTIAVTCLLATAGFVILWMLSLKQGDNVFYVRTKVSVWKMNSAGGTLELRLTPSLNNKNHGFFFMSYEVSDFGPYPLIASPELHLQKWSPSIVIP
jgi:hypothetical protein